MADRLPADDTALEQLRRDMAALLESARQVMPHRGFNAAVRAVFDACRQLVGARAGFAAVIRPRQDGSDGEEILFLEADGKPCAVDRPPPPPVAALMARARVGTPVLENAVPGCPGMVCHPWGEIAVENILVVPLLAQGQVEGLIGLVNRPGGFTDHDNRLASTFAGYAVLALENGRVLDALEENRERFRAVVESAADAIVTIDERGLLVGWNPAASAMFGRDAADVLGHPLSILMPEECREGHREELARTLTGETIAPGQAVEMVAVRADGSRLPVEVTRRRWESPEGVHFTAILRDISARKAAERAKRESDERFRMIAETSGTLLSLRDREGKLLWNNAAYQRVLGYTPESLPDPFAPLHPEDRERVRSAWSVLVDQGGESLQLTFRYRSAWGEYVALETTARRITVAGEAQFWVSSHDVTELTELRLQATAPGAIPGIVGRDPAMQEIAVAIRELARADVPVLVLGESGTGKELVASAIHRLGPRGARSFVPVNCAALPEQLLESELFGHVRGAFTGAYRDKKGRFELAHGGTIFLDEVAEIPPAVQVKLLRVLQEGVFERVGSEQPTRVDVRVVSATNRDLRRATEEGRFREDLFYRIGVVELSLPPLRERVADIPLLIEHFLGEEAARAAQRQETDGRRRRYSVSSQALAILVAHPWPGNVRELQNALRHAIVKSPDGRLLPEHLPRHLAAAPSPEAASAPKRRAILTSASVAEALVKTNGNRVQAARLLGVSRATFYRFLEKAGR